MLFDAHNHLQDEWLRPHWDRIDRDIAAAGIAAMVVNGTCESDWSTVAALAGKFPWVRPSLGLHPWDVGNATSQWRDHLQRALDATPGAAIGEIGLDRWILERAKPDDPRLAGMRRAPLSEQTDAFLFQLRLAAERNLPVSIHCLDAWGSLSAVLRESPRPRRGFLLHAYGGSAELARDFAALGAYFSFNGNFLPPARAGTPRDNVRAERFATVFRSLPRDRLLVETDAPAMPLPATREVHPLPPLPDGTRVNHPANLTAAYAGLAEILRLPLDGLIAEVAENFRRCFD